jgi:RNA polymerase sigma factor (sigma-70 family)
VFAFDDSPSLEELLEAVSAGDEGAKQRLCQRYDFNLCGFARYYSSLKGCRAPDDHSRDINQTAWETIFRSIIQLRDPNSFVPWAKQIIRREVIEHVSGPKGCWKGQQNIDSLEEAQRLSSAGIVPAHELIMRAVLVDEVFDLAETFHPKLPKIMRLRIEGLGFKEIALSVEESYGNVRTIYSRGLKELGHLLRDTADD